MLGLKNNKRSRGSFLAALVFAFNLSWVLSHAAVPEEIKPIEDIDKDNSFRGIPFGTLFSSIPNLEIYRKSKDGRHIIARMKGEKPVHIGVPVDNIYYCFFDQVFYAVSMPLTGVENIARMREAATKQYGPPFTRIWNADNLESVSGTGWFGNRVIAGFVVYGDQTVGFSVRNRNFTQRFRVWQYYQPVSDREPSLGWK